MIKVVHCKKEPYDVYIGRSKKKFHYGNPFSENINSLANVRVATREDSIQALGSSR